MAETLYLLVGCATFQNVKFQCFPIAPLWELSKPHQCLQLCALHSVHTSTHGSTYAGEHSTTTSQNEERAATQGSFRSLSMHSVCAHTSQHICIHSSDHVRELSPITSISWCRLHPVHVCTHKGTIVGEHSTFITAHLYP